MNITRKRFIVMRNNRSEVWCGLSKNFYFKPISEIKDTPVKTYHSQAQAEAGCSSWDRNFEVVPVIETIEIDPSANSNHMKFKVGSKVRVKNVYSGGNFDDGDIVTIKQIGNEDEPDCYGVISPYDGLMWYLNEDEVEAATCDFCSRWNWGEASADVDNGKFAHIYLAGGAFRFPVHKQFMYCPVCGVMNPNRAEEKEVRDEL